MQKRQTYTFKVFTKKMKRDLNSLFTAQSSGYMENLRNS